MSAETRAAQAALAQWRGRFINRVREVLALREVIVREGGHTPGNPDLDCVTLYGLRSAYRGRQPTAAEWQCVENKFVIFNSMLDGEQRRKFALRQYPTVVMYIAIIALIVSLVVFNVAVYPLDFIYLLKFLAKLAGWDYNPTSDTLLLFDFIWWNICLGALGSIAFISVNALSMQADVTFDITNTKFVLLRIILGSLFGVLIALPIAYIEFARFCLAIAYLGDKLNTAQSADALDSAAQSISATQALYLLLPFLVGFSASLFMAIISKFIAGVQSLFGVEGSSRSSATQQPSQGLPPPKSMLR